MDCNLFMNQTAHSPTYTEHLPLVFVIQRHFSYRIFATIFCRSSFVVCNAVFRVVTSCSLVGSYKYIGRKLVSERLHDVTAQKTRIEIFIAVRTSELLESHYICVVFIKACENNRTTWYSNVTKLCEIVHDGCSCS
jgi:hypothetical protein